ncbi:DUF4190 domain-containing protein [Skermania sp. ID1734]|uniref:DUF4190 domain-containing protein n=1 Tax=Skermania sp. ID1734 TaxID=2597516 RepID=UPI00117E32D0|nr:DUF4190 domain-containing protein [Skermania sp. ID1734]TSE01643.1 DUF4190 domain-containing protein [Skermania sp. ID1734]
MIHPSGTERHFDDGRRPQFAQPRGSTSPYSESDGPAQAALWPFFAGPIFGFLLLVAGFAFKITALWSLGILVFVLGTVVVIIRAATRSSTSNPPAAPIAYTADGRPIYPVVGYTPDGLAITADRAVGYQPINPRTNSLAIAALVLGFVFPVIAIPIGHIACSQIRRTGEQGRGMALTGLILGYISVLFILFVILAFLTAS